MRSERKGLLILVHFIKTNFVSQENLQWTKIKGKYCGHTDVFVWFLLLFLKTKLYSELSQNEHQYIFSCLKKNHYNCTQFQRAYNFLSKAITFPSAYSDFLVMYSILCKDNIRKPHILLYSIDFTHKIPHVIWNGRMGHNKNISWLIMQFPDGI